MLSSEGENVTLIEAISTSAAKGQVEKWLLELETYMKKSVHKMVAGAIGEYLKREREKWVLEWPGQCVNKFFNSTATLYLFCFV